MRRWLIVFPLFPFAFCLGIAAAHAQQYPSKPVRWIVPSSAGGANDVLARIVGAKLTQFWGQQVVVDVRPGAGGIIGSDLVAKAPPDGYTLLDVAPGYALNPFFYKTLPYDTLKDFERITVMAHAPNVLVTHPSVPAKNVKELIALAKVKPGELNYASSGRGTGGQLCAELFQYLSKTKMTAIYYKGAGDSVRAVVSGEVSLLFSATGAVLPMAKAGKLRMMGVSGSKRFPPLPDVPTVAEQGLPGYDYMGWYAALTTARVPKEILAKLHADMVKAIRSPDVIERMNQYGFEPVGNTPEEFTALVQSEMTRWGKVLKAVGVQPE
ncbi:MAG TPA: tripartite tricarboxylate transporter substrate binding protein [Burkholderiales bacterium]|nr:tripartite tricarboxylate transporter substrate binding protein [Burkholderiales bacterium]